MERLYSRGGSAVRVWWPVVLSALWFLSVWLTLPGDSTRFLASAVSSQRPSHSLNVGGQVLDFDARMMGMYLGFLASFPVLGSANGRPAPSVIILGFVCALSAPFAVDGLNSLFDDQWDVRVYEPTNVLRFLTGTGAGLAVALLIREATQMIWPAERVTDQPAPLSLAIAVVVAAVATCAFSLPGLINFCALTGAIALYTILVLFLLRLRAPRSAHLDRPWSQVLLTTPWAPLAVVSAAVFAAVGRDLLT